jgi:hypothetical protein
VHNALHESIFGEATYGKVIKDKAERRARLTQLRQREEDPIPKHLRPKFCKHCPAFEAVEGRYGDYDRTCLVALGLRANDPAIKGMTCPALGRLK